MKFTLEIEWLTGPHGLSDEALAVAEDCLGWVAHSDSFMAVDFPDTHTNQRVRIDVEDLDAEDADRAAYQIGPGRYLTVSVNDPSSEIGWTPVVRSDNGGWEIFI